MIKFFRKDFYAKHFRIILIDIIMQYAKVSPIPASYFYFRSKYLSDHLSKIIIKISTQFSNHYQIQDLAFLLVLRMYLAFELKYKDLKFLFDFKYDQVNKIKPL